MTEYQNTPALRFPEFQGEWELKKLGDIVTFSKGKSLSKKDLSDSGEPCILYGELYTKYGSILKNVFSKTNIEDKNLVKSKRNQVLVPSSGETAIDIATATCIETDENIIIGGDLNILTPQSVDGRFISFYINGKGKYNLAKYAQGKTVVHLYNSDLKHLNLNLPKDFEEQSKISNFFSKLDRQIELEEEKVELLEQQKKGYMQKIFSQELRFKDENGNDYPIWQTKKLKDLAEINPKNSKKIPDKFYYVDLESVSKGNIKDYKYMNIKDAPSRAQRLAEKNDIFFQTVRPYQQNNFIFNFELENLIVSTGYAQLRTLIPTYYLYTLLHTIHVLKNVLLKCTGSNYPAINSRDLSNIKIQTSIDISEQQKIGTLFYEFDKNIKKQSFKIVLLKQRKQGLLQRMFI